MKLVLIATVLACSFLSVAAFPQSYESAPWPDEEPKFTASTLVRAGMQVNSIEESLKLYEDILGFKPVYSPGARTNDFLASWLGYEPGQVLNLVVVRSDVEGDAKLNVGYIGLAEITNADGSATRLPTLDPDRSHAGEISLMISVEDTMSVYEKVKAAGYEVFRAPEERADGSHSYLLMRGPDNERLWITEGLIRSMFLQEKQ